MFPVPRVSHNLGNTKLLMVIMFRYGYHLYKSQIVYFFILRSGASYFMTRGLASI